MLRGVLLRVLPFSKSVRNASILTSVESEPRGAIDIVTIYVKLFVVLSLLSILSVLSVLSELSELLID